MGSADASLRRIAGLALPALVVLAAEPLYVLVDTAVVGHLNRVALAAVALGGGILAVVTFLGNVLAYGITGRAARRFGAGDRAAAVAEGVQASWVALATGVFLALLAQVAAEPVTRAFAGDGEVAEAAASWLSIAAFGAPGLLLAMAGHGWMRGVQQMRQPMWYVLWANVASAVLCPVLVFPVGMGLLGSAVANVTAQTVAGALFVRALVRERVSLRPRLATLRRQLATSRDLVVRGAAFQLCFLSAAAVAARISDAALGAHQIALQLWFFTALVLDSVAIAAQSLVGATLGAGDVVAARRLAWRVARIGGVLGLCFGVLVAVGATAIPALFSPDPEVRAQALAAWPWFVATQPLCGLVFALDGVLIGASDIRYLRNLTVVASLAFFLPAIWLSHALGLGLGGIWAGLTLFIVVRLAGLVLRVRGTGWTVPGLGEPDTGRSAVAVA